METGATCPDMGSLPKMDGDYTPAEVAKLIERDDVQLIDVRETYEVEAGRIAGSRHVSLSELTGRADEIDRDRPVVFYCRVGGRSAMATQAFQGAGYEAHNMTGGIVAWDAAELPIDGYVADH
jgi:rhodanese-related sulfurtransferase